MTLFHSFRLCGQGDIVSSDITYLSECGVSDIVYSHLGLSTTFRLINEIGSTLSFYINISLGAKRIKIISFMQEVKFSINPDLKIFENGFSEDDVSETAELTKERLGYFERWGDKIVERDEKVLQMTVGIIIEAETGKVYEIVPNHIIFPKNNAATF